MANDQPQPEAAGAILWLWVLVGFWQCIKGLLALALHSYTDIRLSTCVQAAVFGNLFGLFWLAKAALAAFPQLRTELRRRRPSLPRTPTSAIGAERRLTGLPRPADTVAPPVLSADQRLPPEILPGATVPFGEKGFRSAVGAWTCKAEFRFSTMCQVCSAPAPLLWTPQHTCVLAVLPNPSSSARASD
jgi:hypothetical protein